MYACMYGCTHCVRACVCVCVCVCVRAFGLRIRFACVSMWCALCCVVLCCVVLCCVVLCCVVLCCVVLCCVVLLQRRYDSALEPWIADAFGALESSGEAPPAVAADVLFPPAFAARCEPPAAPLSAQDGEEKLQQNFLPEFGEGRLRYTPVLARVVSNDRITAEENEQDVRHVVFDLSGTQLR